jgi:hypothetical protein
MGIVDLDELGKTVRSLGVSDEHRQQFGRSILGTILGQATTSVLMVVAYFVAIVFVGTYWRGYVQPLRDAIGEIVFWVIVTIPLVCILAFSVSPALWRARRERRLREAAIGGNVKFDPGYFRLFPFQETDRDEFKRLDAADIKILNWVKSTQSPILYLSGASGVGKSSLLAASVLPKLRDTGWVIIEVRLFANPIERMRAAVLATKDLFPSQPPTDLPLRELLKKAAEAAVKTRNAPLLVVVDQFEEFLLLHADEERSAFTNLLEDLRKSPIDGLRLLLVFRSDYRPLVFKLNLPPLDAAENWQEVGSYDRGEATAFLQGGGRNLSPEALDSLFRGLDHVEETIGLYRPITLNMVGLVLERMGQTLTGNPARLIQSYLRSCLTASESRDFAKPLLNHMISDAGTKEPRSESDLVLLTHFQPWQVRAALADLAQRGLVRRLDGVTPVWEIAHDFLARLLGQLIGRLRPSFFSRVQPLIAPVVLSSWVVSALLLVPLIQIWQAQSAEEHLRFNGATIEGPGLGKVAHIKVVVSFPNGHSGTLSESKRDLARLSGPIGVWVGAGKPDDLFIDTTLKSLEPFTDLTNLGELVVQDAQYVPNLEPIKTLKGLEALDMRNVVLIKDLEPISGLTKLLGFGVSGASAITNLEPLKGLTNLQILVLQGATNVKTLEPLKNLIKLERIDLTGASGITSIEPLKDLPKLDDIDLTDANGITTLAPLKGKKLERLVASPELLATAR